MGPHLVHYRWDRAAIQDLLKLAPVKVGHPYRPGEAKPDARLHSLNTHNTLYQLDSTHVYYKVTIRARISIDLARPSRTHASIP